MRTSFSFGSWPISVAGDAWLCEPASRRGCSYRLGSCFGGMGSASSRVAVNDALRDRLTARQWATREPRRGTLVAVQCNQLRRNSLRLRTRRFERRAEFVNPRRIRKSFPAAGTPVALLPPPLPAGACSPCYDS